MTSSGTSGIIIGYATPKSMDRFLLGIQIAITQPISLDDVVKVEGEFGRIEEIILTSVVIKIWNERRLILAETYFLQKPFVNLTRANAQIRGTVHFFVDYDLPLDTTRSFAPSILKANPNWDESVFKVQVTGYNQYYKEIRIIGKRMDDAKNRGHKTAIREKVIDFIQANYPESFARVHLAKPAPETQPRAV